MSKKPCFRQLFDSQQSKNQTLFKHALTADDKYSLPKRDNLQQVIQIQLPNQEKVFSISC